MRKNILILGHNDATQFVDIYNQYTRLFDKEQYEVTVAYLTGEPNEETKARTLAEHVVFLKIAKKDTRTLKIKAIRTLLAWCREKAFQLVICHRYKPTYIMMWVAQFHRLPACIFVMHELKTMASIKRKLFMACMHRQNMLYAGVSNAVRDDLRQQLWRIPTERITTLYNMIDVNLTEPQFLSREAGRKALQLPDDAFVFGNMARLAPNKDHATLIQAFAFIKPHCPKATLVIIGNGTLEATLKKQVTQLGLQQDVIFTGFLPAGFRYMKAFDCFVLSSIQEAFGRVLLEAMLAKLPTIATLTHGIPEVMGDTGWLVPAKNSTALASTMEQVYALSQAEREQYGEEAYKHVNTHFSIPAFHEQFWQHPFVQQIK